MSAEVVEAGRPPAPDTPLRALVVTLWVCAFCSAAISGAVTWLRPYQQAHRDAERSSRVREMLAAVPGLETALAPGGTARLDARVVELVTGSYAPAVSPDDLEPGASRDVQASAALPPERDLAHIGRRPLHATVFELRDERALRLVVLPVYGAGYLSTLSGYLALDPYTRRVRGLDFYEHGETPGLGSEIQNPAWRAQWVGKLASDEAGNVRLGVARTRLLPGDPQAEHLVDGISGATKTGDGVTALLRFWLGPDGFGPYLERLAREHSGEG